MGLLAPRHRYTYREYLDLERESNCRHEFFAGEIYAMAGGTPEHAALAMGVGASLLSRLLDGPCRAFTSDLRVRSLASGLTTYPDVTVVCGPLERDPQDPLAVLNPSLVVEVTSDGTEDYDRSEKLEHYRSIASLTAILLVSHRAPRIDAWRREADGTWAAETYGPGESVDLPALACQLEVDRVYRALPDPIG